MPQNRNIKLSGLNSCCFKLINDFEQENCDKDIQNKFKLSCKECKKDIILNNNNWERI